MATGDSKETRDIPPGTKVICTTCFDENIEGEVVAFDYGAKVIIIKRLHCKTAKKITTETRMLNIDFLKNLEVTELSGKPPPLLPTLDIDKIDRKIRFAIDQKRQAAEKIGINVSPEGQRLFDKIHKTFKQVRWDGQRIVIMDDVTIDPPYKETSCQGNQQSLEHIRKIVKKHQEDEKNLRPG